MNSKLFSKSMSWGFAEETLIDKDFTMTSRHFHETIEFYFMLEGERYHFVEQDLYHLKPGMALLINHNQLHKSSMPKDSVGHRRFLLQINEKVLDQYFSLPGLPSVHNFGEQYCGAIEFAPEDWQQVLSIIDTLKKEMSSNTPESDTIALLLIMQLIMIFIKNRKHQKILLSKSQNEKRNIHDKTYQIVQKIILYLENHSHEPYSLDDIAAKFYISRAYLTRIFKSFTGFTITEYIAFCRVKKAKVLLTETSLSITEISTQIGFGNVTYFEKIFKRMTDLTPLQYRKQNC